MTRKRSFVRRFGLVAVATAFTCFTYGVVHAATVERENAKCDAEKVPLTNTKARIYAAETAPANQKPIHLGPGPHLFVDDYLIASSDQVTRVVNRPQRDDSIPNPVVTGKGDGCFQPYVTVLRDAATGRFRIWYAHRTEDSQASNQRLAYMESEDGVHWIRPPRLLQEPAPMQFGVSIIDEGPAYPDATRRYKLGWWKDGGLKVAASPDGWTWTPLSPEVVLHHNHDITSIAYDSLRHRYVATISVWPGQRRVTMQSFSSDLLTWTIPHYVITPQDGLDEGETQFYAMEGYLTRGDLVIGMVKVLRDDLKADTPPDPPDAYGVGYTALAWTRDGETWTRDREHFFDPAPQKGAWDHAHAWIDEQVPVGDEIYFYYGGYARGHKVNRFEERQIGMVKMKRDRYVARVAGSDTGWIVTPPVILDGAALTVNADASGGSLVVQILDETGHPLPGFAAQDTTPITTDAVAAPVQWSRDLARLKDKPVRLDFALQNAHLFAFDLQ